jgi:putative GTP pyrophosphokinase
MDNNNMLPGVNLVGQFSESALLSQANGLMDTVLDIKSLLMEYACAIREIKTKLEILDTEFAVRYSRNPISAIHTRLKSQTSIVEKMFRKGVPISRKNIENTLNDIAGIRVICSYIDDIYRIADALIAQDDITLIEKKDYIENPKPNGYRSLHLIVSVPVFFAEEKKIVKAEVQIRTIAMDFWASLEHGIKYKKDAPDAGEIVERLKECADVIAHTDREMQDIRIRMDESRPQMDGLEKIYEKLKRFDVSF